MIYFINMTELEGDGSVYPYIYGNTKTAGGGWNRFFINTHFADSFEWADGRAFSYDDVIEGYSLKTPVQRSVYSSGII